MLWRTGRRFELGATVSDSAGLFCCRVRRCEWSLAWHELIRTL
jgi:hypothetical protein